MPETPLADGFPPIDRAQWHQLVAKALARSRGAVDPDEVEGLTATPTDDGYALHALYTRADVADLPAPADPGFPDFIRGATPARGAGWSIRQRHWLSEPDVAAAVADDLGNGVDSLWLTGGDEDAVAALVEQVDVAEVPVALQVYRHAGDHAAVLLDRAGSGPLHPDSSLGLDPLGMLAAIGRLGDIGEDMELAARATAKGVYAFTVDGSVYHEAGASFAEELGCVTAAALATMRYLADAGIPPAAAARLVEFRWVVTDDQFASMAKLRAARVLWNRVLEVLDVDREVGQRQHAVTSVAMLTARDPWVNLVRNCVAAFAGGVGGAAAVTVQPHSLFSSPVDDFARRTARNTQHLLLAESHVGFVADPGGGSYYLERRTWELAEAAWSWLQEIEGAGGMRAALDHGLVAQRVGQTWQRRRERLATRKAAITGVSEFPDRERRSEPPPAWHRPGGGLPQHRVAEDYEDLRDRADAAGSEPVVALITLGPLARHSARESYAANLFAAGGVATIDVPFEPGQALALPPGTVVACLCGADADYETLAASAAAAAKEAGVRRLWLAGKPGERAEADAAAGVDDHLYVGCDTVAILRRTLEDLEVPA